MQTAHNAESDSGTACMIRCVSLVQTPTSHVILQNTISFVISKCCCLLFPLHAGLLCQPECLGARSTALVINSCASTIHPQQTKAAMLMIACRQPLASVHCGQQGSSSYTVEGAGSAAAPAVDTVSLRGSNCASQPSILPWPRKFACRPGSGRRNERAEGTHTFTQVCHPPWSTSHAVNDDDDDDDIRRAANTTNTVPHDGNCN